MSATASLLLALTHAPFVYGIGKLPDQNDIRTYYATFDDVCIDTCKFKPELVKLRNLRCTSLKKSALLARRAREWNFEGSASCKYRVGVPDRTGALIWRSRNDQFVFRRNACGEEGQEADLWCYYWTLDESPS